jgi:hypothetical protein
MSESEYIRKEAEGHPEAGYLADLRILRRFVRNGGFGYLASDEVMFRTPKARYPQAYEAFGEERKREVLERYRTSPCIEEQRRTYPNNPDKEGHLKSLERLRNVMTLSMLGYGSREMAMLPNRGW